MNSVLISFLVALGLSTWIYTKMMKSSGGLTKNAITVAAVCAVFIFAVLLSILSLID